MDINRILAGRPWALSLDAFEALPDLVSLRMARFDEEIPGEQAKARGNVAVIPVRGTIEHHDGFFSWLFGGTTVDRLSNDLNTYANDGAIKAIVLDIDSPGGSASGMTEIAAQIRSVRTRKPVVAVANGMAASAAYNIGASASAFYASPSSLVGSVGVYALHMDMSGMLEKEGLKPTFVSAGKYKVEGNGFEPLTDEAASHMQHIVDETYSAFVSDVAKGRRVSEATVRKSFGEGRVLTARDAKAAGMVDDIKTLDAAIKAALGTKPTARGEDEPAEEAEFEVVADDEGQQRLRLLRWRDLEARAAISGGHS